MIQFQNVSKIFGTGAAGLSHITLTIDKGEFVFLVGHTGSGKTTMLRLLTHEILPTEGDVYVADIHLNTLSKRKIPHYRKKIGIVFQDLKLLMDRTILENVLLPLEIGGVKAKEAIGRAEELLADVGILQHKEKFPIQLSGGELQRAAIARALTLSPDILLADEPTGNLDAKTAFEIVELLNKINEKGTTIIMATHNLDILNKYAKNRVVGLDSGKLYQDTKNPIVSSEEITSQEPLPEAIEEEESHVAENDLESPGTQVDSAEEVEIENPVAEGAIDITSDFAQITVHNKEQTIVERKGSFARKDTKHHKHKKQEEKKGEIDK